MTERLTTPLPDVEDINPINPLIRYYRFITYGYRAIGVRLNMINEYGGMERYRTHLHDLAANYLMDNEGVQDFIDARNLVITIINSWDACKQNSD